MQVSVDGPDNGQAMVAFNLDEPCSDAVRDQLAKAMSEYDLSAIYFMHI